MSKQLLRVMSVAILVVGCREKKPPAPNGMSMTMQADSLMPMMRTHLDSMAQMAVPMNPAMRAKHEELVSRMLDAMGSDMRMMGMRADSAWSALSDSVRQDLAALPTLSSRALATRTQAHVGRMRRLLDMHATMMRAPTRP